MPCNFIWKELPKQIVTEVVEPLKDKISEASYKKMSDLLWYNLPNVLNDFFDYLFDEYPDCITVERNKFIWFTLNKKAEALCTIKDLILNCEVEDLLIEGEEGLIQFFFRDTETYEGYFNMLSQITIDGESALGDDRVEVEQITTSVNWVIDEEGNITFIGSTDSATETIQVRIIQKNKPENFILFDVNLNMRNNETRVNSVDPVNICNNNLEEAVTITGQFFTSLTGIPYVTDVLFNGESAVSFNIVNSTTITAVPPLTLSSGEVQVEGDSVTTSTGFYIVHTPAILPPITGDDEVCSNSTLQLDIAVAGSGWSSSDESIATVDGDGLVTPVSSGEVDIIYTLIDLGCTSTATKTITIYAEPIITTQPVTQVILEGEDRIISVEAEGDELTYQWKYYNEAEDTYDPLVNDSIFSGVTTKDLLITNAPSSINEYDVLCEISGNAVCDPLETFGAFIYVGDVGILTQPENQSICENTDAVFNVVVEGTVVSYVWYENAGLGFEPVSISTSGLTYSGDGTDSLTVIGATVANSGYNYFVVIESPTNTYNSNFITLTVNEC